MSRREEILAAVLALVNDDRPDGVPECSLETIFDFDGTDEEAPIPLPSASLFLVREPVVIAAGQGSRSPVRQRTLVVQFEVRARAAPGTSGRAATGPITDHFQQRLGGSRLDNAVHSIEEIGIEWFDEAGDGSYGLAVQTFSIEYQTRANDATQRG